MKPPDVTDTRQLDALRVEARKIINDRRKRPHPEYLGALIAISALCNAAAETLRAKDAKRAARNAARRKVKR